MEFTVWEESYIAAVPDCLEAGAFGKSRKHLPAGSGSRHQIGLLTRGERPTLAHNLTAAEFF